MYDAISIGITVIIAQSVIGIQHHGQIYNSHVTANNANTNNAMLKYKLIAI